MTDGFPLNDFDLPLSLRQRSLCRVSPASSFFTNNDERQNFIFYLPTVVLRHRHNPGFSLACRLANHFQIPLLVLCSVLDDTHLTSVASGTPAISTTARRFAFTLEALQSCCQEWQDHGAATFVRIHGPGARTPHHLTLAHKACAVVTDEAFVEPFSLYNQRIFSTCQVAKVPCWSVDGSTTVPPKSKLRLVRRDEFNVQFSGVPAKAWVWQKQTEPHRKLHVYGATRQGHLTAPDLVMKSAINILESLSWNQGMPFKSWSQETPSSRNKKGVFTVEELGAISDIKDWVSNCWPGVDTRVLPCQQTCGSGASARQRWKTFSTLGGLKNYAKKRNQTVSPHAVSRISCYLNLGILSIFDVVHDVWHFAEQKGWAVGCCKFLEEVVKWREIGYCYTFCHGGSHSALVQAIPRWAFDYFKKQQQNNKNDGYSYNQLEQASTRDEIWNSMQNYLIDTGELHNNARMSWGKTVLHWQASRVPLDQVFLQLCRLNDRFALDGLSPPSYAGILWCFGWGDKPNSSSNGNLCVSTKWASRYRTGPDGFARAKDSLYQESFGASHHQPTHKKRKRDEDSSISTIVETNNPESIRYFFSPVSSKIIG